MAKGKSKNSFANKYANMDNAGGNHKARTTDGILKEGRTSYKDTVDQKLSTNHSKGMNKYAPIKQELGNNTTPKQKAKPKQKTQVKPAPKPKGKTR